MKAFKHMVLCYLKAIRDSHLLDPLQFAHRTNMSMDNAVNFTLTVEWSTFHLPVYFQFSQNLKAMGAARSLFVRMSVNTGVLQGSVQSPLLYYLNHNDCTSSNSSWCANNHLELNKRFLGIKIPNTLILKEDMNFSSITKKPQQRMCFLCQLENAGVFQPILFQFYRAIIEIILTASIIGWCGNMCVVCSLERVIGCHLPSTDDLYKCSTTFFGSVKIGYTIGYSVSLISLSAATIILCVFRKLHCTRNYIHMHLFMSFILKTISVFIKDVILFEAGESDHCAVGSVGCKAAIVFFQYCIMANFFWLLVEGLYLHTLLAISFFSERKYFWCYILIGWGTPSVFITAWSIARAYFNDIGCWDMIVYPYWWIIKAPITVSIVVNFILFICIIRILVQKIHSPDVGRKESSQYLSLVHFFNIHPTKMPNAEHLVFFVKSHNLSSVFCYVKYQFYMKKSMCSLFGFLVAVLYCFLNGEVQAEIKRKWRRWHLERLLGTDMKYHQPSMGNSGTNFSTQISVFTRCSPKTQRASSFQADSSVV
ncbi:VIPR protein, partial [Atractosteus spatula]|nr:VIPR protein [Atractosteus spatula]